MWSTRCAGARVRQLGCLELLAHISRAQPELESPLGEIAHGGDIPGKQRRLVEPRVEDERSESQRARSRGRRHQHRKRRRRPEVVGHVQHVEAQFLRPAGRILNLRPRPRVVQTQTEPEVLDHPQMVSSRSQCLAATTIGQP